MNNLFGNVYDYSIAIMPPLEIVEVIALLKSELALLIGPFRSQNSAAHLSLSSFQTDSMGIKTIKAFLKNYVQDQKTFMVRFISFGSFPGTFHLTPDENSDKLLRDFMKNFHTNSPRYSAKKYRIPHITIGRNLKEEEIQIAKNSMKPIEIQFECNNLTLRKFNSRQFEIEEFFNFKT